MSKRAVARAGWAELIHDVKVRLDEDGKPEIVLTLETEVSEVVLNLNRLGALQLLQCLAGAVQRADELGEN
jgi:hypothetical protein